MSAKEAQDFNQALNYVSNFAKTHHFDNSHSEGASLSNQLGADLRKAETASHNYDASMSKAARISNAKSYVESHSEQISTDLNQAFSGYVAHRVGKEERDVLYAHPGDRTSLNKLQALGADFVSEQRDHLIARYGSVGKGSSVEALYQQGAKAMHAKEGGIAADYQKNADEVQGLAGVKGLGIDQRASQGLQNSINHQINTAGTKTSSGGGALRAQYQKASITTGKDMAEGKEKGQANVNPLIKTLLPEKVTKMMDHHDTSAKAKELIHD